MDTNPGTEEATIPPSSSEPSVQTVSNDMAQAPMNSSGLRTAVVMTDTQTSTVADDPSDQVERTMTYPESPDQSESQEIVEDGGSQHKHSQREQMLFDEMRRLRIKVKAQKTGYPDNDSPSYSFSEDSEDSDEVRRRRWKKKSKRKKIYKRNLGKISFKDKDVNGKLLFLVRGVKRLKKDAKVTV